MSEVKTADLLIEIGCEDLPARYVQPLALALGCGMVKGFIDRGIELKFKNALPQPNQFQPSDLVKALRRNEVISNQYGADNSPNDVSIFATPRRVAVWLSAVAERQSDQVLERKGPQLAAAFENGTPTPAALGFAKSCGVELAKLKKENGQLVFRKRQKGRRTVELLPEIFAEVLKSMDELVPKRMRWGEGPRFPTPDRAGPERPAEEDPAGPSESHHGRAGDGAARGHKAEETFVRPVRWMVALYGARAVPIERFGLKAGRKTYGHRFHAPAAITLNTPDEYENRLRAAKVWADFASRRQAIRAGVEAEAAKLGGRARITDELLEEVTALVEWPVVISGRIEPRFLALPPEVIVATIEHNQRYFPVFDSGGGLLPSFVTVANIESKDIAQVVAGNERVVRPRLADALFFWEQDRKRPLAAYTDQLAGVTFQQQLGSLADKVARVRALAAELAARVAVDAATVDRAAQLAKCDLVTRMVGEFPELQGIMGGYYARAGGESDGVARAIAEHYCPTQSGGPIPSTPAGRVLAIADKLDTLAGCFAIGAKPTASKDPFALRRAALGCLRICIEGELDLDLRAALQRALGLQPAGRRDDATLEALWEFVAGRLSGLVYDRLVQDIRQRLQHGEFAGRGAVTGDLPSQEIVQAIRNLGVTRPLDFMRRAEALVEFLSRPEAAALAAADKRARNILRQAGFDGGAVVDVARLTHPAERALAEAVQAAQADVASLRARADYTRMIARLAELKEPLDAFFDGVMVMADDPALRANRLALLARLDALCREVADLSALPG